MKNVLKFLLMIPLFLLTSCNGGNETENLIKEININIPIDHSYSEIAQFQITWSQMFDIESESYFVYFYSETCSHCVDLKNFIIEKALELQTIYFVKSSNADILSEDTISSINAGNSSEISILGYPSMIKIENYVCIKNVAGISQIKSLLN